MAKQGDGMRVELDLTRYEDQELDISGKFNARVADSQDTIPLWIKDNGYPIDIRKYGLIYGGTDNKMVLHRHIIKKVGDLPLERGDSPVIGKFTLPFDNRTFNVPGKWNQFFIRFIDENGNTVSSIDLKFDVFKDSFFASIGSAEDAYVEEFEDILKELKTIGDEDSAEFKQWIAEYKQKLQDALAEVDDPKDGLLVRYSTLLDMTKQIQETLKQAQFHDRPFQLKTVADMKAYTPLMAGDEVITQGWDDYDDGHGGYWNIRVKHKDETPDENNVISLDNGMVAERNSSLVSADSLEDFMYGYSIKIVHGQGRYPDATVHYYEDAIGTEANGLGNTTHGFGQTNTKSIPCEVDYQDANTAVVRIPRNFYLEDAPNYESGAWYVIEGNKTIKISLGAVDDAKAKASDGQGKSYLSPGTGYFSKPTSPMDLRVTYINQNTQRLDWRE